MKIAGVFLLVLFCSLYLYSASNRIILMPNAGLVRYSINGIKWEIASDKVIFKKKVQVKTGEDSRATLYYPGDCSIKLIANSHVKLEKRNIFISRGSTWFKVVKKNRKFKVSTKSVLVGVWGTEFEIEVSGPDNNFLVYDGTIELEDRSKKKQKLSSGYIIASRNGIFKSQKRLLSDSQLRRVRQKWFWADDERLGVNLNINKEPEATQKEEEKEQFVTNEEDDKKNGQNESVRTKFGAECYISSPKPDISTSFGPSCTRTRFSSQCNTITRSGAACSQQSHPTTVPTPVQPPYHESY